LPAGPPFLKLTVLQTAIFSLPISKYLCMYLQQAKAYAAIRLSVTEGVFSVQPADIIRLEASSNYTFIHFTNRRPLLIARVLGDFEAMLGHLGFVRIHRSHLVNRAHVSRVDGMERVVMRDTSVASIARRKKGAVKGLLAG
jgi:two-component system, LytTR family, response regulator